MWLNPVPFTAPSDFQPRCVYTVLPSGDKTEERSAHRQDGVPPDTSHARRDLNHEHNDGKLSKSSSTHCKIMTRGVCTDRRGGASLHLHRRELRHGTLNEAVMTYAPGSVPLTIHYQCGDRNYVMSQQYNVTVQPTTMQKTQELQNKRKVNSLRKSSSETFSKASPGLTYAGGEREGKVALIADMGIEEDSFTIKSLLHQADRGELDLVLHAGDLSYADNFGTTFGSGDGNNSWVWVQYMTSLHDVTARVPYMTCPGNHEAQVTGKGTIYAGTPLSTGKGTICAGTPLSTGKGTIYAGTPLSTGKGTIYAGTPLSTGKGTIYAGTPLSTGKGTICAGTPLSTGKGTIYAGTPLSTGKARSTRELLSAQVRHDLRGNSSQHSTGKGTIYAGTPLSTGKARSTRELLSAQVRHDLRGNSSQHRWLEQDLRTADQNRARTPWILVFGHRPLYCSSAIFWSTRCTTEAREFRSDLEELFRRYHVDVYVCGHNHQYERSWPVSGGNVTAKNYRNPAATVHIVSGAAGNPEGNDPTYVPEFLVPWRAGYSLSLQTGWTLMEVNSTALAFSYIHSADLARMVDSFTITKTQ
uniref:Acid phosphatase n=1 Tax=Branchiostoma floridae TaxID=7739 RepID=C3YV01_BRAFL|eukprot:XP_002599852.1 hypothetical protein BRAFLDRAFT_95542 [Branchiostoma floridae]